MKISTKSQYGLRAMVYLAKYPNEIRSLKAISKAENISFDYLEKIISILEKASLVQAKKGAQGGYFLVNQPKKIKIGEIIRALEGEIAPVKCIAKKNKYLCPREKECLTKHFWEKIQNILNLTFNSMTLADLLNK